MPSPPTTATRQRYECNRMVNAVLTRHAADLARLSFSCSTRTVSLTGRLVKHPAGEFTAQGVEALLRELETLPGRPAIRCSLDNWEIAQAGGAWQVTPKRQTRTGSSRQDIQLDGKDDLEDAIRGLLK